MFLWLQPATGLLFSSRAYPHDAKNEMSVTFIKLQILGTRHVSVCESHIDSSKVSRATWVNTGIQLSLVEGGKNQSVRFGNDTMIEVSLIIRGRISLE